MASQLTSARASRRSLLRLIGGASLLSLGAVWRSMAAVVAGHSLSWEPLEISLPLPMGLSLHGPVAVLRTESGYTALSRRCTHLGCQLRVGERESLVCPCHGSRFDDAGNVLAGPARTALARLACRVDPTSLRLVVERPR